MGMSRARPTVPAAGLHRFVNGDASNVGVDRNMRQVLVFDRNSYI